MRTNRRIGHRGGRLFPLLLIVALMVSCAAAPSPETAAGKMAESDRKVVIRPPRMVQAPAPEKMMSRIGTHIIGTSIEGRAIEAAVMGSGPGTVLILAGVHGDETAGTELVRRLTGYLNRYPELLTDRKLVLIPVVNPDGMVRRTRENARGVDINRNFNTWNWTGAPEHGLYPLSEPESQAVVRAVGYHKPVRVIALHQPLACIDYDGPGMDLARYMADFCPLPLQKLGAQSGSLGSFAGFQIGIPIITYELPEGAEFLSGDLLWERYGFALIAAIRYPVAEKERAYASSGYGDALETDFPAAR